MGRHSAWPKTSSRPADLQEDQLTCGCETLLTRTQSETHASRRVAKCRSLPDPFRTLSPRWPREPLTTRVFPPPQTDITRSSPNTFSIADPTHPKSLSVNTLPLPPCLGQTNCFDTSRQFATAFNFPFPFAFYPVDYQKRTGACVYSTGYPHRRHLRFRTRWLHRRL